MESVKLIHKAFDKKLNALSVLVTVSMEEYIGLTQNKMRSSYYQRKVLPPSRNKVFKRLIEDLKVGTTVPALSIAVINPVEINEGAQDAEIEQAIKGIGENNISILDGIQRTNCFIQVKESLNGEELDRFLKSEIRIEMWVNIPILALLYRMVVLNAGQTTMSLRHQLEILNFPLKTKLKELIVELELFEEGKETRNRNGMCQYKFSDVIEAFLAFIGGDPEVDKNNEVAQRLEKLDFLSSHSDKLENTDEEIKHFAFIIGSLDKSIHENYTNLKEFGFENNNAYSVLGSQPTLVGISAAWGEGYLKFGHEHMKKAEEVLLSIFQEETEDPLGLSWFAETKQIQSKRVGDFERRLFYRAFLEFIEGLDLSNPVAEDFEVYWNKAIKRESKSNA
ncbi:hypothetical protein [Cohnella mopanensis]|uniref:hypothetical protein n=1 Tax=Cohnella mopanensis TaxID=2911966 RepID=UPI001EF8637B|nr:hypothetical protein [Cohnella mopanensis]